MANHPQFKVWQDKIKLMRAQNATASAPAASKKEVDDKLKLLETAVNKFDVCFGAFPKQWQQLQEVEDSTRYALEFLKERFNDTQGEDAEPYRQAIAAVDGRIGAKQAEVEGLRKQIEAKESALADLKKGLAGIDEPLKGVETLCDDAGKWGADVAKARKDAEGIPAAERPIDAWTAISALQGAYDDLVERLKGDPPAEKTAALAAQFKALPDQLAAYRAAGQELDALKGQLKTAEAALEEMRKSRADLIVLELDNPTPPLPGPDGDGGDTGGGDEGDGGGGDPDEAPVGATRTTTPHMRGEGRMWGDTGAGEE